MDELERSKYMDQIEIYWQDLTEAKQKEIVDEFGDNFNWDVYPMAVIDIEKDSDDI